MTALIASSLLLVSGSGWLGFRSFRDYRHVAPTAVSRYTPATRWLVLAGYLAFVLLTLAMFAVLGDEGGLYDRIVMGLAYGVVTVSVLSVTNSGLIALDECFVRIDRWGIAHPFHRRQVMAVTRSRRGGGAYRVRLDQGEFVVPRRMRNADAVIRTLR